ncbi:hypothetical protein TRAPUB_8050 [Trametes pubescens]|uniref:DUF4218 domain-containing protein n=1 Tax=Trametes pubescens TaxID=154538 RepID=A0A1M2W6E2_TRAPU|nr:hypothetical protein TRAPUB_8050 [Trametes pubescens]
MDPPNDAPSDAPEADAGIVTPGKRVCSCSACARFTCVDLHGEKQRGRPQYPKTIKRHTLNDQLLTRKREIQEEALADAVLLATLHGVDLNSTASDKGSVSAVPDDPEVVHQAQDAPRTGESSRASQVDDIASGSVDKRPSELKGRLNLLSALQSGLDHRRRLVPFNSKLAFTRPPVTLEEPPAPIDACTQEAQDFLEFYNWLQSTRLHLASCADTQDRDLDTQLASLLRAVQEHIDKLKSMIKHAWELEKVEAGLYGLDSAQHRGPVVVHPPNMSPSPADLQPFVLAALIMVTILHAVHGVNRVDSHYILTTIRVLLFGALAYCGMAGGTAPTEAQVILLKTVPKDVRTALKRLNIDPEIIRFACCPRCFKTYRPDESREDDPYPHACQSVETDRPECGALLVVRKELAPLRKGDPSPRIVYRALKTYPYRTLASWLAALFLRPAMEQILLSSWDQSAPSGSSWTDIFHSPEIRRFRGPDGKLFSMQRPGSLNLVFGLFIDWFNPFGNKKAGKSHSVGAMYMVCLNFPPEIRYRPENIYLVAIIPGPKEPSLHQLNHLLHPLVDELESFWSRGLFLKRTALRFLGLFLRIALIPLICDLPALRKAAGFASHSSKHFCSFCRLRKHQISDIHRPWPTRTAEQHRQVAREWRDADTEAKRSATFDEHGIRWSELLRLPYWDPTRFPVVDAMHCLFLGNLRHHCRDVWGIDVKDNGGSKKMAPHTPEEQSLWLNRVVAGLRKGSRSALSSIRKGYIAAVAQVNDVSPSTSLTKKDYITALLDWTTTNSIDDMALPPVLSEDTIDFHVAEGPHDISKFRIITQDVINVIRADICNTILPSWLEPPPKNFGNAAHGKLKADQWRTVCTVNLTITLTRLWGVASAAQRERLLLENFIHLVTAVDLATRRSMSEERAKAFDDHMFKYLQGLRELFAHDLVPNHHLSLHLVTCLLMFGPVHGWWAFPFERYNGLLGALNTNNLSDGIALTFMHGFYSGAELRWLMASTSWPADEVYQDMVDAFHASFKDAARGTRASDVLSFGRHDIADTEKSDSTPLPSAEVTLSRPFYDEVLRLMPSALASFYEEVEDDRAKLSPYVQHLKNVSIRRVNYATRAHARRDSYILFNLPLFPGSPSRAGQISDIFKHRRLEAGNHVESTFLVVDSFQELTPADQAHDPYRAHPGLQTRLCYTRTDGQYVIRLKDVVGHFAAFVYSPSEVGQECIVCRSLDRASSIIMSIGAVIY